MVRSIERAMDVLALVADATEPVPLATITRHLKLPRTSAFNIVRTLTSRGAVEWVAGKGYRIGTLLPELARSREPGDLIVRSRPHLVRVAAETGETALLSVVSGDEIVFIDKAESPQAIRYTVDLGTRRPMYCSAHGKVALASLPDPAVDAYLQRTTLRRYTEKTHVESDRLRRELVRIRQQGFAISDGEFIAGVYSISAPIRRDPDRPLTGMISVTGPLSRVKPEHRRISLLLLDHARRIIDGGSEDPADAA